MTIIFLMSFLIKVGVCVMALTIGLRGAQKVVLARKTFSGKYPIEEINNALFFVRKMPAEIDPADLAEFKALRRKITIHLFLSMLLFISTELISRLFIMVVHL